MLGRPDDRITSIGRGCYGTWDERVGTLPTKKWATNLETVNIYLRGGGGGGGLRGCLITWKCNKSIIEGTLLQIKFHRTNARDQSSSSAKKLGLKPRIWDSPRAGGMIVAITIPISFISWGYVSTSQFRTVILSFFFFDIFYSSARIPLLSSEHANILLWSSTPLTIRSEIAIRNNKPILSYWNTKDQF